MGVEIRGPVHDRFDEVLTADALELLAALHEEFEGRRAGLLKERARVQADLDAGGTLEFPQGGPR